MGELGYHFDKKGDQPRFFGQLDRIVGTIEGDIPVTLDGCSYHLESATERGAKYTCQADIAYFGTNIGGDEKALFSTFKFSVDGLDEWLGLSDIDIPLNFSVTEASCQYRRLRQCKSVFLGEIEMDFIVESKVLPPDTDGFQAHVVQTAFVSLLDSKTRYSPQILLLTKTVDTIIDDTCASAHSTTVGDGFPYHATNLSSLAYSATTKNRN